MRLSDISIERPVFATVMSLLILVAGGAAFFSLPVRELPDVDSPVVSITTLYVGASPETVEASVTQPLEDVLNGIEGIRNIDSLSAFGVSTVNVRLHRRDRHRHRRDRRLEFDPARARRSAARIRTADRAKDRRQ